MADGEERRRCAKSDVERALRALHASPVRVSAADWPADLDGLDEPGLYSWWVDDAGATVLGAAVGGALKGERIYAGQTGATKWPSGRAGSMTLRQRVGQNHLRGSIYGSTFRRTLAACLMEPLALTLASRGKLTRESEDELSAWMRQHLHVAVHAFPNRDALGDLEDCVLAALDPPLNLEGMRPSPVRARLGELRGRLGQRPGRSGRDRGEGRAAPDAGTAERTEQTTLHDEIVSILQENGRRMKTGDIATFVNERGRYAKRDGSPVTAFQIHGRTRNYPHLFERDGQIVTLRSP